MNRTTEKSQSLSSEETGLFRSGSCPDCLEQDLLAGPEGGFAQNVKCGNTNCGSLYNDMWVFGVERLTNASPLKLPERKTAYRN